VPSNNQDARIAVGIAPTYRLHRAGVDPCDPDHLVANIAAGALRLTADELAILG